MVVVVVVFGFAVRVKLPAGGNLGNFVVGVRYGVRNAKNRVALDDLACQLPPTRDSLDHGRGKCDAAAACFCVRAALQKRPGMQGP